jgi:quercetin dioxygenase-like cupin family protein
MNPSGRGATIAAAAALIVCAAAALAWAITRATAADAPRSDAKVVALTRQALEDMPNKEVQMVTVEYPPGGSSPPHRHNAHVFVYVLEGALRMQVAGHDPVLVHTGETFYEGPADVHQVSANASTTAPARFLAVLIKDRDRPASSPAH